MYKAKCVDEPYGVWCSEKLERQENSDYKSEFYPDRRWTSGGRPFSADRNGV